MDVHYGFARFLKSHLKTHFGQSLTNIYVRKISVAELVVGGGAPQWVVGVVHHQGERLLQGDGGYGQGSTRCTKHC
jgi:hypothetical protein